MRSSKPARVSKSRLEHSASPPREVAESLLAPVLKFLRQAGISERDAVAAFQSAWKTSSDQRGGSLSLTNLANPQPFVDLVGIWTRNSDYLDRAGLPRELAVGGRFGFAALVRKAQINLSPREAMAVLLEYGNVERVGSRIKLTKPFFHIRSGDSLAFEPSVRFLLDAAGNVSDSLSKRADSQGRTGHFWRTVDTRELPRAKCRAYLDFVKVSSLSYLQDIDDWLSENACAPSSRAKRVRVGLGLFTLGSDAE
jgi:hypothetical protein